MYKHEFPKMCNFYRYRYFQEVVILLTHVLRKDKLFWANLYFIEVWGTDSRSKIRFSKKSIFEESI